MNTAALRALYATLRVAGAGRSAIDTDLTARLHGAPEHVVAAFASLLGVTASELAARIAADHRAFTVEVPARERAFLASLAKSRAAAQRREQAREARRLARETAATITEW